jgi:protein gp37
MAKNTIIAWATDTLNYYTWNCNKVSEGCKNCYAAAMAARFPANSARLAFDGAPNWRNNAMKELRRLKSGAVVFVNSMSDTYHEKAPVKFAHWIHNLAAYERPDVTFLLLTKRPERALALSPHLIFPPNLWVGTSVESSDYLWRLQYLLQIPAAGHFVSAEPLLGSLTGIDTYLRGYKYFDTQGEPHFIPGLKWVIVGGESGDNRRPFNKDWAREIRDMCIRARVPFMFKQGSHRLSERDKDLDGQEWNESPFVIEKRQPVTTPATVQPQLL